MCDSNGNTFIAKLYNILLAPDICNRLSLIITLMNLVHTCLFHKGFLTVYFVEKENNAVTLPRCAQQKHLFWGEIKQMSKSKKLSLRKKFALELLDQIIGHRYTRSLMDLDSANFFKYIELIIDQYPFFTSCQIS